MPRKATASVSKHDGQWRARVTIAPKQRKFFALPTCTSEDAAKDRGQLLADIAQRLRKAGHTDLTPQFVERAAERNGKQLAAVVEAVDRICTGKVAIAGKDRGAITFQGFADQWTSGELHKRYPDHVKLKKSASDDRYRLQKYVYPIAGDVPLTHWSLDHAEAVMRSLPESLSKGSRRQVAQLMHRVLAMAVFPARIREANPLPRGFLPATKNQKAMTYLYPDEDKALMGCIEVPLHRRVIYGFLTREGMRRSEAERLTWADVDLERGAVTLDENKTSDPRAWALDPGVALALRAWWEHCGEPGNGPVFVSERGRTLPVRDLAAKLRDDLQTAGVDRPALFARTEARQPMRAHDLRATFITVSLANGQSEAWVADRTGHKTSAMINRYRRAARSLAELGLGDLTPLNQVVPEFAETVSVPFETALKRLMGDSEESGRKGSDTIPGENRGSRGRTRTDTFLRIPDFESGASANSATRPRGALL